MPWSLLDVRDKDKPAIVMIVLFIGVVMIGADGGVVSNCRLIILLYTIQLVDEIKWDW